MKKRILVFVDNCKPGMILAQNVFNDYGAVVISEDSIIDSNAIDKFKGFGIEKILIYENIDPPIIDEANNDNVEQHGEVAIAQRQEFKEEYRENVIILKNVLKDISSGKELEINQVNNIVETLLHNRLPSGELMSCLNEVRTIDEYTYTHSVNVALLCMMIGKWQRYSEKKIKELVYAGLLHDIGKSKIDLAILNKPSKLTNEEFDIIKKHVLYGYRILENIPNINKNILYAVLMHHERENGSGYILGAKSAEIHEYAKIVAVADVFDAMTSKRVYKDKISPFEVFEYMQTEVFVKFDPNIVLEFLKRMAENYIGDRCRLTNGQTGEIVHINPHMICKPLVKVGDVFLDLSRESDIKIQEVI